MSNNAVNIRLIQNLPTPAPETSPPITSHSEESQSTLILAITVSTSLSSQEASCDIINKQTSMNES